MSEVSSSLPTEPALVYLSDPARPGYMDLRLTSYCGLGYSPTSSRAAFQNPARSMRFLRFCLVRRV